MSFQGSDSESNAPDTRDRTSGRRTQRHSRSNRSIPDPPSRPRPRRESRESSSRPTVDIPAPAPHSHRSRRESRDSTWTRARPGEPDQYLRSSRDFISSTQQQPPEVFSYDMPPPPYNQDPLIPEEDYWRAPSPQTVASEESWETSVEINEPLAILSIQDVQPTDAIIAVMGMTGSGKTTFISHFCSSAEASHGLESSTNRVEAHLSHHRIRGRRLIFIDTPGFDDTFRADTQVLQDIVSWLTSAYEHNLKLTGLIYLHGVNVPRVLGSALANMQNFRQLCGDESMSFVALATTHWSRSAHERRSQQHRHQRLISDDLFWREMIQRGARPFQHDNEPRSAWRIVNYLLDQNLVGPGGPGGGVHLRIQREMAVPGMTLDQTTIGSDFERRIEERNASYEVQIRDLQSKLQETQQQEQRNGAKIEELMAERRSFHEAIEELKRRLEEHDRSRDRLRVGAEHLQRERERYARGSRRRNQDQQGRRTTRRTRYHEERRRPSEPCTIM